MTEAVNWQRGEHVLESMAGSAVVEGILAGLNGFQTQTETHKAMRYTLSIEAKILDKKDREWRGGWTFYMISEGITSQKRKNGFQATIAPNRKPTERPTENPVASDHSPMEQDAVQQDEEGADDQDKAWWEEDADDSD